MRTLDSIPALIRDGGILPLSADCGNSVCNPKIFDINVWSGNGEFVLYEDGREIGNTEEYRTEFSNSAKTQNGILTQALKVAGKGNDSVIPQGRILRILFKDAPPTAKVSVLKNGKNLVVRKLYKDCAAAEFSFEHGAEYVVEVSFPIRGGLEMIKERALGILTSAEGVSLDREFLLKKILAVNTMEEYSIIVKESSFSKDVQERLLETM